MISVLINSLSGVGTKIALDSYESLKSYFSNEFPGDSDSFYKKIAELDEITIYSAENKESSNMVYKIKEVVIQKLSEKGKWYQILIVDGESIQMGYIYKSDIQ